MTIDMTQFHQVFFEEAAEHLVTMESLLRMLDVAQPDPEQLETVFRAVHSIKGSSGAFGFTDLTEMSHVLEILFDRVRKKRISLQPAMVDLFLAAHAALKAMLAAHRDGGESDKQAVQLVSTQLALLVSASEDLGKPTSYNEEQA